MLHHSHLDHIGFNVFRYSEPFSFRDCEAFCENQKQPGGAPSKVLSLPMIQDLREVSLAQVSINALQKHAQEMRRYGSHLANNDCVYLVADVATFGMMRMYAICGDILKIREEANTLVTDDIAEAVDWICERHPDAGSCREAVFALLDRPIGTPLC